MALVYSVLNIVNGKIYVGQTSKSLEVRRDKHLALSRCNKGGYHLHRAIKKYGAECFNWEIIAGDIERQEEANALEDYYIKEWGTIGPRGYNEMVGGLGGPNTEDAKAKIRAKSRAMWKDKDMREKMNKARELAMHRPDVMEKRKANWIRLATDEVWKKKMQDGRKRVVCTEEYRKKQSIAHKKIWEDPERRERARIKSLELAKSKEWREAFEKGYRPTVPAKA